MDSDPQPPLISMLELDLPSASAAFHQEQLGSWSDLHDLRSASKACQLLADQLASAMDLDVAAHHPGVTQEQVALLQRMTSMHTCNLHVVSPMSCSHLLLTWLWRSQRAGGAVNSRLTSLGITEEEPRNIARRGPRIISASTAWDPAISCIPSLLPHLRCLNLELESLQLSHDTLAPLTALSALDTLVIPTGLACTDELQVISCLTHLTRLELGVSYKGMTWQWQWLQPLSNLRHLELSHPWVLAVGGPLAAAVPMLRNLTHLHFPAAFETKGRMGHDAVAALAELTNLRHLGVCLDNGQLRTSFPQIQAMSHLTSLYLDLGTNHKYQADKVLSQMWLQGQQPAMPWLRKVEVQQETSLPSLHYLVLAAPQADFGEVTVQVNVSNILHARASVDLMEQVAKLIKCSHLSLWYYQPLWGVFSRQDMHRAITTLRGRGVTVVECDEEGDLLDSESESEGEEEEGEEEEESEEDGEEGEEEE